MYLASWIQGCGVVGGRSLSDLHALATPMPSVKGSPITPSPAPSQTRRVTWLVFQPRPASHAATSPRARSVSTEFDVPPTISPSARVRISTRAAPKQMTPGAMVERAGERLAEHHLIEAQTQRVQANETMGVGVVVIGLTFLEGHVVGGVQALLGFPADDDGVALI